MKVGMRNQSVVLGLLLRGEDREIIPSKEYEVCRRIFTEVLSREDGEVIPKINEIMSGLVLGMETEYCLGSLSQRAIIDVVKSFVYAAPGYRITMPYALIPEFRNRAKSASASGGNDLAIITALLSLVDVEFSEESRKRASKSDFDNTIQVMLKIALRERLFNLSRCDSKVQPLFSKVVQEYVAGAFEMAKRGDQSRLKAIKDLLRVGYEHCVFADSGMTNAEETYRIRPNTVEAEIYQQLCFKYCHQVGLKGMLSMIVCPWLTQPDKL